jgi:hypothetical protein
MQSKGGAASGAPPKRTAYILPNLRSPDVFGGSLPIESQQGGSQTRTYEKQNDAPMGAGPDRRGGLKMTAGWWRGKARLAGNSGSNLPHYTNCGRSEQRPCKS